MQHDRPENETKQQPRAARLWIYEHSTPLVGAVDANGNEIVVTTAAAYDLDRQVLVIECFTPTVNERSVVDCTQWRGPSGSPGMGAAIRALVEFEDRVIDTVRAWSRLERTKRCNEDLDRRAREAAGETER